MSTTEHPIIAAAQAGVLALHGMDPLHQDQAIRVMQGLLHADRNIAAARANGGTRGNAEGGITPSVWLLASEDITGAGYTTAEAAILAESDGSQSIHPIVGYAAVSAKFAVLVNAGGEEVVELFDTHEQAQAFLDEGNADDLEAIGG